MRSPPPRARMVDTGTITQRMIQFFSILARKVKVPNGEEGAGGLFPFFVMGAKAKHFRDLARGNNRDSSSAPARWRTRVALVKTGVRKRTRSRARRGQGEAEAEGVVVAAGRPAGARSGA